MRAISAGDAHQRWRWPHALPPLHLETLLKGEGIRGTRLKMIKGIREVGRGAREKGEGPKT